MIYALDSAKDTEFQGNFTLEYLNTLCWHLESTNNHDAEIQSLTRNCRGDEHWFNDFMLIPPTLDDPEVALDGIYPSGSKKCFFSRKTKYMVMDGKTLIIIQVFPYKTMLESKSGLVVGKMLKNCVIMTVQLSMTIYCLWIAYHKILGRPKDRAAQPVRKIAWHKKTATQYFKVQLHTGNVN